MSIDFPRAWEISRSVPIKQHNPRCSYASTQGALLCDCHILFQHPEYDGNPTSERSFTDKEEKLFDALKKVVGAKTFTELEKMKEVMEEVLQRNPGHQTALVSLNAVKVLLEYWPSGKE
jgi:hypothetical protein